MTTSLFIAIPLPPEFHYQFATLLKQINAHYPEIQTVRPQTPHITLYYLDKMALDQLAKITEQVENRKLLLASAKICISDLGYFSANHPSTIYLQVQDHPSLHNFNQAMRKSLNTLSAVDNNHIHTLARLR